MCYQSEWLASEVTKPQILGPVRGNVFSKRCVPILKTSCARTIVFTSFSPSTLKHSILTNEKTSQQTFLWCAKYSWITSANFREAVFSMSTVRHRNDRGSIFKHLHSPQWSQITRLGLKRWAFSTASVWMLAKTPFSTQDLHFLD